MSNPIEQQKEAIEKLKALAKEIGRDKVIPAVEATMDIFKSTLDVLIEEKAKSLGAMGAMVTKMAAPIVGGAFASVKLLIVSTLD